MMFLRWFRASRRMLVSPLPRRSLSRSEKGRTPAELADSIAPVAPSSSVVAPIHHSDDEDDDGNELYLECLIVLPFVIPTLTEMIVTWGAGSRRHA